MSTDATRPLVRLPVPPGADGVRAMLPALTAALDGSGPAIAPIPVVTAAVSSDYITSLLAATRPDDPNHPLEANDVAVVLPTSGSTGAPRGVLLTADQLTALSDPVNGGPGASPVWIAALPITSMGGFNVVVRSLAAGHEPVALPSIGGAGPFTAENFAAAVATARASSDDVKVSLVPAQVSRLLSSDIGIDALRQCRTILVGGAALRPSLRDSAAELDIALVSTYGATETAGGCVYDSRPLPGVHVSADGVPGVLTIAGPCVAAGYRADPELTARHFIDGAFRTADLGTVAADGSVDLVGRADDVVIINGVNVSPAAVERVVADLPDIAAAAAVVVPTAAGEPAIWVFVEARDRAPDVDDRVQEACTRRLGRPARPHVRQVPSLPHLPNGKVDRRLLQEWASAPQGGAHGNGA